MLILAQKLREFYEDSQRSKKADVGRRKGAREDEAAVNLLKQTPVADTPAA